MKGAIYERFGGPITVVDLPDPAPPAGGVVLRVEANGICRSDWHGWMGHDSDISLPHVPGHEISGVVEACGSGITRWRRGDRVTLPFVCGCGRCGECASGNHHVCPDQFQPGFTSWGSFAQYVAIEYADTNLVALPDSIEHVTAASLGCRFATSFRAVVDQAKVTPGEWVAVFGCGGVGLSAIAIASAVGARVIAVDIRDSALALAADLGAEMTLLAAEARGVSEAIVEETKGGVQVGIDALGNPITAVQSIRSLARRGRHVQVGLLLADQANPPLPMDIVVARELTILGSHGIQAHRYGALLAMIEAGRVDPSRLVRRRVALTTACSILQELNSNPEEGITVVTDFDS